MNIGPFELAIILILALILYGKRLPEVLRAVGKGYAEFKKNLDTFKQDLQKPAEDIEAKIKETNKIYESEPENQSAPEIPLKQPVNNDQNNNFAG